jgi:multicomponent Na+:H+ antiporter subunit E
MAAPGRYRNIIVQAVFLMAIWLILSGHYDFLHILYGVVSVALVVGLNLKLRRIPLVEDEPAGATSIRIDRLLIYLPWLLLQIIKSGIYVVGVVLHPRLPVQPEILYFRSRQPGVMAKVILGNSITLTPGTLTLDILGDDFTVHALTRETARGLYEGAMPAWVASLYRKDNPPDDLCTDVVHIAHGDGLQAKGRRDD